MIVRIQGFAWEVYTGRVMPAFARWLVDGDDTHTYHLFEQTRCAQEELFVPQPMRQLRTWTRAKAFAQGLPRGPHTHQEYALLCDPGQFTPLSDRYVQTHPPQLYQDSEALRTVWGALVQQFCLPWYMSPEFEMTPELASPANTSEALPPMESSELISLLQSAGLNDLIDSLHQSTPWETPSQPPHEHLPEEALHMLLADDDIDVPNNGVIIGRLPTTLHLRGWLASHAVRAMALFEFLACGRRAMPFGYQGGDPYGNYIGYLTPTETALLASSLQDISIPDPHEAETDYHTFLQERQLSASKRTSRLIDEVQPSYAGVFVDAIRIAAQQQLGLICSIG
ncbi:hypothetical protein KSC_060340 [Ktedonobacter sp. SOSP1-52]|uniref:hypothetical protein n=1 Tax=Ktedonobacter sp. SOSP1-52 TaxID=2778366 RepID=UPI001915C43D|nr:hypothetical protein [Ktedonobacter sp. SOSP1-52]GHO67142.1 hypothetical protein KSC_060340 [Ktedonobacter sp. SOSP1-52]